MAPKKSKSSQMSNETENVEDAPSTFASRNTHVLQNQSYRITKRAGLVMPVNTFLKKLKKGNYAAKIRKGKIEKGRRLMDAIFNFITFQAPGFTVQQQLNILSSNGWKCLEKLPELTRRSVSFHAIFISPLRAIQNSRLC